ncbi:hypothetical protein D3C78_544330 [compost metagenome]
MGCGLIRWGRGRFCEFGLMRSDDEVKPATESGAARLPDLAHSRFSADDSSSSALISQ